MDKPTKTSKETQGQQSIAVPIDPRTFGEFLAGLLGQRRRLSRDFDVTFSVDQNWLHNLDQLVVQRVELQNEGTLVDFSFKLFLQNGRITHVTAHRDFAAFRDLSNVESVGAELIWTFLVKFPTSALPEKQEVRFLVKTAQLDDRELYASALRRYFAPLSERYDQMKVEILYSNVTWGEDLMQLISTHVSVWFHQRNTIASKSRDILLRLLTPIGTVIYMFSFFYSFSNILDKLFVDRVPLVAKMSTLPVDLALLNAKLDLLLLKPDTSLRHLFVPLIILTIGMGLILLGLIGVDFVLPRSFVLLNDFTINKKKQYTARRQLVIGGIGIAFLVGTLSSIFAQKLTEILFG